MSNFHPDQHQQSAPRPLQTPEPGQEPRPTLSLAGVWLHGKTISLTLHPGHIAQVRGGRAAERLALLSFAARRTTLGPIDGACAPWPALLVLDRPEQGLDVEGLRALMRRVSTSVDALGTAVLLHTEDARLADMADTVVNLDRQHVCGRSSVLGRLWH